MLTGKRRQVNCRTSVSRDLVSLRSDTVVVVTVNWEAIVVQDIKDWHEVQCWLYNLAKL